MGVGFGKWGHLFREYTDINAAERDPPRYRRENWQVRIDGIEGHATYLTELHRFLYNDIHIGDACELLPKLPAYDLIFMGDIIEHLEKPKGQELLQVAVAKANKAVIVSTPKFETAQEGLCANELERHRSLWSTRDFRKLSGSSVKTVDGATLLAVIAKPGTGTLQLTPPPAPSAETALRLTQARDALIEFNPLDEPFVLVDEEQLRPLLPHRRALRRCSVGAKGGGDFDRFSNDLRHRIEPTRAGTRRRGRSDGSGQSDAYSGRQARVTSSLPGRAFGGWDITRPSRAIFARITRWPAKMHS